MRSILRCCAVVSTAWVWCPGGGALQAQTSDWVLSAVYPAGLQAGTEAVVTIEGGTPASIRELRSTAPGFGAERIEANRFRVTVPAGAPPGIYDLRVAAEPGLSNPRALVVGRRPETLEAAGNDTPDTATPVELNTVVNGKIEKPGDVDYVRFTARGGRRVVIECLAERIDSQLRGVLEVFDAGGRRLAVSRGDAGLDPRIDFLVPADGDYVVRLTDLSYLGGATHFYRLDLDGAVRPEFALPCVVMRGRSTRVKLFGRNLTAGGATAAGELEAVEVSVAPPDERPAFVPGLRRPAQIAVDAFAFDLPGSHAPTVFGVTDVPVVENVEGHERPDRALELEAPCEVSAQLAEVDGRHWYALRAKRGEAFWLEGLGERIGSPVDLELSVLDAAGDRELARFSDELDDPGGYRFSTAHVDPAGRWVAPADGRYLLLVRNLTGGAEYEPRRIYRLSVRREEPDFQLAVVSRRTDRPAAWNVPRGGREAVEVLALRRRGFTGPIRVTVEGLPPGLECPETWIGPEQDRGVLVATSAADAAPFFGAATVVGHADEGGVAFTRRAYGGTMIWPGRPTPSGRVAHEVPLATSGAAMNDSATLRLTASPATAVLDQHGVLDVEVVLESPTGDAVFPATPVRLAAIGLPRDVAAEPVGLPAGASRGRISFFWPTSLPAGSYTFAVRADSEPAADPKVKPAGPPIAVVSNPITVELKPARILLDLDPATPTKIARGTILQLRFTARRVNGFLGKVHTELTAPGGVVGLRARGVTFTGQTDSGSLQVIATDNAPLGRHALLRLEAVGTVEDQPLYRAGRPVELEIVE